MNDKNLLSAAWVFVWVCVGCGAARAEIAAESLPLAKGNRWTYAGERVVEDATHPLSLTVEVLEVRAGGAARVSGDVRDTIAGDGQPRERWIVPWALPLARGQRVCPEDEPRDSRLCWVVEEIVRREVVARGAPRGAREVYVLVQHDNTGSQRMEVAPGVGVLAYGYHHNGQRLEIALRLIEVALAPRSF